jgi:hypothetical protein
MNMVVILDAPNRSRPASSLTSSPASSGEVSGPSVFGELQFGPGRDGTPSSERIDLPAGSPHFGKIRLLSALPLPSPLMAVWCNEHGTGLFFFTAQIELNAWPEI